MKNTLVTHDWEGISGVLLIDWAPRRATRGRFRSLLTRRLRAPSLVAPSGHTRTHKTNAARPQVGSGSAALLAPLQGVLLGASARSKMGVLYDDTSSVNKLSSSSLLAAPKIEIAHCSWCLCETAGKGTGA